MYTTVHTLQEPTTDIILEILKEPIQNEQNEQDPEFKMKTAYRQCVDLERLDKDGMNFVSAEEKVFLSVTTDFIFFSRVYATLHPALSVGRLVGWSVGRSHLFFDLKAPAIMI